LELDHIGGFGVKIIGRMVEQFEIARLNLGFRVRARKAAKMPINHSKHS
jgi:hypothetical protein